MNMKQELNLLSGACKYPVLVVEDKVENQALIKGICKKMDIECDVAENGQVALEIVLEGKKKYGVYIVDLMMPIMDGTTFVKELKKIHPGAIVIIQTALDSADTIISLMKQGIYDYIIKPIDPGLFQETLLKGLEYKYLKDTEYQHSMQAGEKIRSQIDWLNYKESRRLAEKDSTETKSIYNVKTSLAQGAGFGSLITMIDIMGATAEQAEDGRMLIEKDIYDMMVTNNDYCRAQIDGLNFATQIMEKDFELKEVSSTKFLQRLPKILERVLPYLEEKKLKLTYPEIEMETLLKLNDDAIDLVVEEMIVNAYKYACKGSTINIFTHINHGYFWFSVKNEVDKEPYGGVPKDFEKLVLEPFFRIHPPDESVSKVERIGFGLGLAVADYVAKKHGGIYFIHDVVDMTGSDQRPCVLAEILLPVYR